MPVALSCTQNWTKSSNHGSLKTETTSRTQPGAHLPWREEGVCFMKRSCRLFLHQLETELLPDSSEEKLCLCPREEAVF